MKFRKYIEDLHKGCIDALDDEEEEEDQLEDIEVVGTLECGAGQTKRGDCENLFWLKKNSQPDLIAMAQGLMARFGDPFGTPYMFDLDNDDLLIIHLVSPSHIIGTVLLKNRLNRKVWECPRQKPQIYY